MSVRQYIGARYVTKIYENSLDPSSAEWEASINYEPLTMVTYNNGSYLSKKEVPASVGNPASNPVYWVQTGFYNGQIADLQNQITALDTGLKISQRYAVVIGNSYSEYGQFDAIKDLYADARGYYGAGTGFLPRTGHTGTFEAQLNGAISDPAGLDADLVTDIIVLSAWGDTLAMHERGISTFKVDELDAMQSFVSTAKAAYPNLKQIRMAFLDIRSHCTITGLSVGPSYFNEPFECNILLETLAQQAGIDYMGWISFDMIMDSSYTDFDYYHPNTLGHTVMGSKLRAALTGAYATRPISQYHQIPMNLTTGSHIDVTITLTPYNAVLEFATSTVIAGTTPNQYDTINDLFDFSSLISSNALTVPFCFAQEALGIIFIGTTMAMSDVQAYKCYTYNAGNGAANISGQAINVSSNIANGNNRFVLPNSIDIEFTE